MRSPKPLRSLPVFVLSVAAALLLAGCTSAPAERTWTFDEARATTGLEYEADDDDVGIGLRLLEPRAVENLSTGEHEITFLLYDVAAMTPVEDALFVHPNEKGCAPSHSFCADMPAMGHGTSPERSPEHRGGGVYVGMTTLFMPGEWMLHINPELADGTIIEFDIELDVLE